MKLAGAILLVLSGVIGGALGAARLQRRVRMLRDLKMLMQAFQTGIRFAAASLPELILEYQDFPFCRLAEKDGEFLLNPARALEGAGRVLLWDNGDWELYQGFVQGLGVSDVQGQMEHLELYRSLLEPRLEQAREEAMQKSKVFVALGLFAGVTLSLLLL